MFRWDFAKSAEAMLSRWAIKRICRFLLKKKKIGDYIDLEQLDVQLAEGVIHLRDLALNVDFINEKLGDSPVFVKEGTILSISFKIPWKMKNCEIEIKDLELVIAPRKEKRSSSDKDVCALNGDDTEFLINFSEKHEQGMPSASLDVHEGVKTIAKIVKWFLTSFNIVIRNLIIAYDSCSESDVRPSQRNLVLRMADIEYGTRVSEDNNLQSNSLLGIAKLTNFIKFQGATIEFLRMDDIDSTKPVICGSDGGFSGIVNLSIPWKNGSLDISKIDADISVDPVELWLHPSTLQWFMNSWELLKKTDDDNKISFNESKKENIRQVHDNSSRKATSEGVLSCADSQINQVSGFSDSPSPNYIIQNWVTSDDLKGRSELEGDYGLSIDQFFECFDEVRSSRGSLGNSGIWNWTCSVFSAITAASSIASESVYFPCEQHFSETNLTAKISSLSFIISFDEKEDLQGQTTYESSSTSLIPPLHCLEVDCQEIDLSFQFFQEFTEVEATIKHIQIGDIPDVGNGSDRLFSIIERCQDGVAGTLPDCPLFNCETNANFNHLHPKSRMSHDKSSRNHIKSVSLLQSFGTCCFKCSLSQNSNSPVFSSFSFHIPPLTVWVDFSLVNMLSRLVGHVRKPLKGIKMKDAIEPGHGTCKESGSSNGNLQGDVFFSRTRIILCFPTDNPGDNFRPFSWSNFIALDFSALPGSSFKEQAPKAQFMKGRSYSSSTLLHLHSGYLDAFLITSDEKDSLENGTQFVSKVILSTSGGTDSRNAGFIMLWQEGPVTGPWLAKRAWDFASSQDPRNKRTVTIKGDEFSSVKRSEDQQETSAQVRQEMILSSSFLVHIHLPDVSINLSSIEYKLLYRFLNEVRNGLSSICFDEGLRREESFEKDDVSQATVLLECDIVDITMGVDNVMEISNSSRKELSGSWNSLRLRVQKFELLSVSNVGGLKGEQFLWLSHCEGDLWGLIVSQDDVSAQNFLLITCKNSSMNRGGGEGGNVLCSGSTGISIIHAVNQTLFQSLTSVVIRCATIIAPGGRFDWFGAISSFFSVIPDQENKVPEDFPTHRQLFFLDLVDIALCYNPHIKVSEEKKLSCLLAASSLSLYEQPSENASRSDYSIQLQDTGLLISEQLGYENETDGYSANYLRKRAFVKVAKESLIRAVLRTNSQKSPMWELELCDSHIGMSTCSDTMSGLARLAGQLQQLFAPDVKDALVHLQSRWNSFKQSSEDNGESCAENSMDRVNDEDGGKSNFIGIMDEILDDAFRSDNIQSGHNLDMNYLKAGDLSLPKCSPLNGEENVGFPQLIESYYVSGVFSPSGQHNKSDDQLNKCPVNTPANKDADLGKGRWFKETPLTIVEDHILNRKNDVVGNQSLHENKPLTIENSHEKCMPSGRVIVKNINLVWRMYGGRDWPISDESARDETVCLEVTFSGVNLQYDIFPDRDLFVSKIALSVKDFHLYDKSINAPWIMVLGYYNSRDHPRESSAKAVKLELESVKPDPSTPLEEYRLLLRFLPMRLHLHQGQLEFLVNFFSHDSSSNEPHTSVSSDRSGGEQDLPEDALLPFFQKFDIYPAVVRVDYIPHHVDMAALRAGQYVQLINLVPWKGIDIQLKPVHAVGMYGWGSICETVAGEWLEDISQNQIHKVLKGLTPVRSLFAVSSGAAKLVSLPVKTYRRDQRLVKGLQRGALAFIRSVSLEAVGLGVHLSGGAHELLLQTENVLSGGQLLPSSSRDVANASVRCNQPRNSQDGLQQAFESLSDGFGKTTSALVRSPLKTFQRGAGAGPALASALRAAPAGAVAPASAVARAFHCTLLGVRNSLDPEHKKESMEKYLGSSKSREQ